MLVFTGGEPLVRPDLFDLLAHSHDKGLVNVVATNATLIDRAIAKELRRTGVRGLAVSLDHTEPDEHNRIRGSETAYERAIDGMKACREAGIALQINFTAMPDNRDNAADMLRLCEELGASIMLCYQVVPLGRGKSLRSLSDDENRDLVHTLAMRQARITTIVEPVAAPQYWAYLISRGGRSGSKTACLDPLDRGWRGGLVVREGAAMERRGSATFGVSSRNGSGAGRIARCLGKHVFHGCTAGWGLLYIKPDGEIWPCPFVPVSGGNVRERPFAEIWRKGKVFQDLRDRNRLKGSCGTCEFRRLCGGCRGKALAQNGDYLSEDPSCFLRNYATAGN